MQYFIEKYTSQLNLKNKPPRNLQANRNLRIIDSYFLPNVDCYLYMWQHCLCYPATKCGDLISTVPEHWCFHFFFPAIQHRSIKDCIGWIVGYSNSFLEHMGFEQGVWSMGSQVSLRDISDTSSSLGKYSFWWKILAKSRKAGLCSDQICGITALFWEDYPAMIQIKSFFSTVR